MFLQLCNIFLTHLKLNKNNNKYLPNYGSAGGPFSGLLLYCTFSYILVDLFLIVKGGGSSEPKDPPMALYLGNCTPQARWNLHPRPWSISHGESGETGRSLPRTCTHV